MNRKALDKINELESKLNTKKDKLKEYTDKKHDEINSLEKKKEDLQAKVMTLSMKESKVTLDEFLTINEILKENNVSVGDILATIETLTVDEKSETNKAVRQGDDTE